MVNPALVSGEATPRARTEALEASSGRQEPPDLGAVAAPVGPVALFFAAKGGGVQRGRVTIANALAARLEASKAQVKVAESGLAIRRIDYDDLQVRAPFKGVVISKDAQPGEIVSPMSAGGGFTRTGIATIVDMDSREVEVDVNESNVRRVHPGQHVTVTLASWPDWAIPAQVITIVPTADRSRGTIRVRIKLVKRDSASSPTWRYVSRL